MKPIKFIKCSVTITSDNATTIINGTPGVPYKWNATLAISTQSHSDSTTTPVAYAYTGQNVNVGDYIVSSGDGRVLKVSAITSKNDSVVLCILEDEDSFNVTSSEVNSLDGTIPNGPGIEGYIFEVKNNSPIIGSIPTALPGNLSATFAQNIKDRFLSKSGGTNVINSSVLQFGDGTSGDQKLYASTNATNKPNLAVIGGVWKFSNDGTTYQSMSVYTHPTTDGSMHIPATGTTSNGKFLKAGSTAGSFSWSNLSLSDISDASSKANLTSPAFLGTPTAPTAASKTNSTQLATTAYVDTAITTLVGNASTALDTLGELATQFNSSDAASLAYSVTLKAPLASPALTGVPTAPTAVVSTNTDQVATTKFVRAEIAASGASATPAWSSITGKPADLLGYGLNTTVYTKTEVRSFFSQSFSFTIAFVGSTPSPTAPSDLPAGWSYAVSGNDVTITHNAGEMIKLISYWGISTTGGIARYRLPTSGTEATVPLDSMTTKFTFRISTTVSGADLDGTAKVVVVF